MAYIGRGTDKISNIEVLDNITFDGSSSYSITKSSVAFVPNSAQSCLISIDGVVQATNFTVSTSTIDFGVAIAGTSTCDFFLHYGTGLITVPADGSVTTAKLGDASVTSAKLGSDVTQGITMADQWRLTADTNTGTDAAVTTNWERNDDTGYASLGTGLTESSGIFSFPETGLYYIVYTAFINMDSTDPNVTYQLRVTTNNSTYDIVSNTASGNGSSVSGVATTFTNSYIINVTDITNVKFKFQTNNFDAGTFLYGFSSRQWTGFSILRIGDSQ